MANFRVADCIVGLPVCRQIESINILSLIERNEDNCVGFVDFCFFFMKNSQVVLAQI